MWIIDNDNINSINTQITVVCLDSYNEIGKRYESADNDENKVFVYLARISDISNSCKELLDIKQSLNKVNIQRQTGYKLLEYAVKDRWGIDEDISNIKISPNGKPYTDRYKFSISHSNDLVCVAISDIDVGVDIECVKTTRDWNRLSKKILNNNEQDIGIDSESMTDIWTKKEAVFKLLGDRVFSPSNIDVSQYNTDSCREIFCENNKYIMTIATYDKCVNYLVIKNFLE